MAAAICGVVDGERHPIALSTSRYFGPLVMTDEENWFVNVLTGPPNGARKSGLITQCTFDPPDCDAMLAITDGLIERRGEIVDQGLGRLRAVSEQVHGTLTVRLSTVVEHLAPNGSDEITVMPGFKWERWPMGAPHGCRPRPMTRGI